MRKWRVGEDLPPVTPAELYKGGPKYTPNANTASLKSRLADAKTALDEPYKDPNAPRVFAAFDDYKALRYQAALLYGATNASNAFLKFTELMGHFPLVRDHTLLFANCELPGSFVLAYNHYVQTRDLKGPPTWLASSIVSDDKTQGYLVDQYGLWRAYPDRWFMDGGNNGDTTVSANIRDFRSKLQSRAGRLADLYTSDAGIDVSKNYNLQEQLEAKIHLGQTVAGLATLAEGGSMVVKTFTYFEPFSVGLIRILAGVFREFYICKPVTSRPANSEVYFVGLGYRTMDETVLTYLLGRLDNFTFDDLVVPGVFAPEFITTVAASREIFEHQIRTLRKHVAMYYKYRNNVSGLYRFVQPERDRLVARWFEDAKMKRLPEDRRLRVVEKIS